jgi:hypothetical protein
MSDVANGYAYTRQGKHLRAADAHAHTVERGTWEDGAGIVG